MTQNTLQSANRLILFMTVFLTGASVMVIELLGTRMIAPFYGTSLYVWSSLISVTMIALAVGYYSGGHWADKAQKTGLSLIIALAALCTLLIPWLTRPVLLATDPLGLRGGAFASSLLLFFPSLTFLGMVGPFAIKLLTSQVEKVGANVGSIYAISTVGSVMGTLLLGFFLFPWVGSRQILIGLALTLLVLAIAVGCYEKKKLGLIASLKISLCLTLLGLCFLPFVVAEEQMIGNNPSFKLLSEQESLYGWVRVIDQQENNLRILTSDSSTIGASSTISGKSRLSYQDIVGLIPSMRPHMQRALIVGLGAGHMSSVLQDRYGISTDTLEIDPAVAKAAVRYFDYTPTGQAIIGDARYEIRHLKGPYDLIIHDCFTGGSEPAHLLTVETITQLKNMLSEQGILAVNFVALTQGKTSLALSSVAKTLDQVFTHRHVFISEPGDDFNDFIFLASTEPIDLKTKRLNANQISWLKQRIFPVEAKPGMLLTDNLNPLEHLQIEKAEHYRNVLVSWFGAELLVR